MSIWICTDLELLGHPGKQLANDAQICSNCREVTEEKVHTLLAECARIERHIAENVPHLEPASGSMSVTKIRAILRGSE